MAWTQGQHCNFGTTFEKRTTHYNENKNKTQTKKRDCKIKHRKKSGNNRRLKSSQTILQSKKKQQSYI